ncbi:MAG: phospholipid carrier-dependent glycosyltransferase [Thermosynechococcaceae cyanobacterium]
MQKHRLFWPLGLGLIWGIALALRFWGLDRFNTLVFDEIYFARFGHNYLTHTPFFDAHPPLGKYFIAIAIGLKGFTPWGYRWMNALVGSLIPVIVAGIAYRLSHRPRFALFAGGFAVLDGLLLVESRYALINIYLLLFGLLTHYCFLTALEKQRSWQWLTLTGICIGATIGVKWNGLWLILGPYGVWVLCYGLSRLRLLPTWKPATRLARLSPLIMVGYIGIIAVTCYSLIWIPHLQQNVNYNFWQVHSEILSYHRRIGDGPAVHPYCAAWYTWPWMLRPLSYFYQRGVSPDGPMPVYGPSLPTDATPWIFDVHGMGNPPLWWFSTLAMALLLGQLVYWGFSRLETSQRIAPSAPLRLNSTMWVPLYLCVNYAANLLPWVLVSRCTFIYHYLPAAIFSSMAAAWLIDRWLDASRPLKLTAVTILGLVLLSFIFWLPIYLGLPLSQTGWQWRLPFRSWI